MLLIVQSILSRISFLVLTIVLSVIVRNANFGPGGVSCMSSFYPSELTTDHPQYDRAWMNGIPLHYYEPIEIKSSVTQNVFIKSNSTKDLYGYLYHSNFSTLFPSTNQLASNDDDAGNQQFKINYALTNGTSYILVVTTFYENVVAPFTIEIIHSYNDSIKFTRTINITISNVFSSMNATPYPSELTSQSDTFVRYGGYGLTYYFQAFQVNVSTTGLVTLMSNSTADMYGCLYNGTFYKTSASTNLMSCDDDSGRNTQFRIRRILNPMILYTLVATTYYSSTGAVFTIIAHNDNGTVELEAMNLTTSQSPPTTTQTTAATTTATTTTTTTANRTGCSSPHVTLIPRLTSFQSPAQFRRSKDFHITSDIVIDCFFSSSIQTQWTIIACPSTCSNPIQFNRSQMMTSDSELYISARTLDFGLYQINLTVTMALAPQFKRTVSVFVLITSSDIMVNLIALGTSIITTGREEDLILDPGHHSIDPDSSFFESQDWFYQYYCRPYDLYRPIFSIPLESIDQPNAACFINRLRNGSILQYGPWNSSVTILSNSLASNQTYQFLVNMMNRQNGSRQVTGYLVVKVQDTKPQLIVVGCVISTMCSGNTEYQFVNPSTQVALYSMCLGNCTTLINIDWSIYEGSADPLTNVVEWKSFESNRSTPFKQFFGRSTPNFTVTNQLFENENISYWRFEAIYTFGSAVSSSALNFRVNQTPKNGSCSIDPSNGTSSTLFTIICSDWIDDDGIKDYSIYVLDEETNKKSLIGYAAIPYFRLRLPAGRNNRSSVELFVQIRDELNGVTNFHLDSVVVIADRFEVTRLIELIEEKRFESINTNPTIKSLVSGNPNVVGQILTSICRVFNQIHRENIDEAVSNGVPSAQISVSSLTNRSRSKSSMKINTSALTKFQTNLNSHAKLRDFLMTFIKNLSINDAMSLNLQASTLAQLTESTNQLTRDASNLAASKCEELSEKLVSFASKISFEDVQHTANHLSQCASNVLTAIHSSLQDRTNPLELDDQRANALPEDYDTDLESEWSNQNLFVDGHDFSWDAIRRGRNKFYQKRSAKTIEKSVETIYRSITKALNVHLNVDQKHIVNTSSVFVSTETISIDSLANRVVEQVAGAKIRFPSNSSSSIENKTSVTLRSVMQPLASSGNARTNLSTSLSLTLIDSDGNEIPFRVDETRPIELTIPRDSNLIVSDFHLQNVTSNLQHNQTFNHHLINVTRETNLSISVHLEIRPLNFSTAFWLIYRFDRAPQLNSTVEFIDGWTILCPSNSTRENFYRYAIDNRQISHHQSIIFGLRELNSTEKLRFCSNSSNIVAFPRQIFDTPMNFSSNYELRSFTSGCYYLDTNQTWQSDGLIVGPLTDFSQTHCFSTHLTTFAGGFVALPAPINWNYVFSNADFNRNKMIYLTVIVVVILYLIFLLFSYYFDRKDREKIGTTILPVHDSKDRYLYEIIVFTGHRRDAGTNSNVHFVLGGDDDETGIRTFCDSKRKLFQRGSIDVFLLAVPKCLGTLNYLRLWHDNSGKGSSASWFLKYVLVNDLQTMKRTDFICQRWLAVEHDDGSIERLLPVASEEEKRDFGFVLAKNAYQSVSDGHLWFSIFARPSSSSFTRVQRCTCCFVLLFTSMLFNILYYDQMNETESTKTNNGLTLGPFHFTSQQIGIGIIVEFCSLIPSLFLVGFFRRIRSRRIIKKRNQSRWTLPWWCAFIAYGLSLIIVGVSIFIIIARGIEFGQTKTEKWFISLIIGFVSSIFFTQPLKIICLAIFFAFCCQNRTNDDHGDVEIEIDEENFVVKNDRRTTPINRLEKNEIASARHKRINLIKMNSILREIFVYFCFIWIIFFISYSNRNPHAFRQVEHLRKFLLNIDDVKNDYMSIISINDYWRWLKNSFVVNLRAQRWYNGEPARNLSGFLNDRSNRFIGWAKMKQRRNQNDSNRSIEKINGSVANAFRYRENEGFVYEFRGSLSNLRENLSILHRFNWIDNRTRSIEIHMSLYNPNVQLFTSVVLSMEFLMTGGLVPSSRFDPIDCVVNFTSPFDLIISIIYLFFIVYLMIEEIRLFFQLKSNYFHQFWSYIQWGLIVCSWIACGIYIWRRYENNRIGELFHQTRGDIFIDLRLNSYLNDLLTFQYGFCCFFASIKFLRFAKYSRRLSIYGETISYASKDLLHFTLSFLLMFFAFLILFFLLFTSKMFTCSSLLHTAQMLFEMILMKFDTSELLAADGLLGPICFIGFIFFIVFVGMTMFISIISDSFRIVRNNVERDQDDDDRQMFAFMWNRFQRWIGVKQSEQNQQTTYMTPLEGFPEKIDRLMIALIKVNDSFSSYMDQSKSTEK